MINVFKTQSILNQNLSNLLKKFDLKNINYILLDFDIDIDIIFNVYSCCIFINLSDFVDEYEFEPYENIFRIINKNYIKYENFYLISFNETNNKKESSSIVKKIEEFLLSKFSQLILFYSNKLVFQVICISTINELTEMIHSISNYYDNSFNFNNIISKDQIINIMNSHELKRVLSNNLLKFHYLNILEHLIIINDKTEEALKMIKEKYLKSRNFEIDL